MIDSMPTHVNDDTLVQYASVHEEDRGWWLLRIAVIVWASLVLLRHATYWGGISIGPMGVADRIALPGAMVESVLLIGALVVSSKARHPTAASSAALAWIGIAFMGVVLLMFSIETSRTIRFAALPDLQKAIRLAWQFVSRAGGLIVPMLCIIYHHAPRR